MGMVAAPAAEGTGSPQETDRGSPSGRPRRAGTARARPRPAVGGGGRRCRERARLRCACVPCGRHVVVAVRGGGGSPEPSDPGPRQEAAPREGVWGLRAMPCPAVRSRRGAAGLALGVLRGEGGWRWRWAGLPGRGLKEGGRAVSCGAAARHAPSARGVRGSGGDPAPAPSALLGAGEGGGGGGGLRRSPGTAASSPGGRGCRGPAAGRRRVPAPRGSGGAAGGRWAPRLAGVPGLGASPGAGRPARGGGWLLAARTAPPGDHLMPLAAAVPCSASPGALARASLAFSCPCAWGQNSSSLQKWGLLRLFIYIVWGL